MPPLSDSTKTKIDSLSREDLRRYIDLENRSPFQGDGYAYLKTRWAQLDEAEADEQRLRDNSYRDTEIRIADDANTINRGANRRSTIAIWVAVIVGLVALVALFK
jgi:hypothetical protein